MATILSTPLQAPAEAPLSARRNAASLLASLPESVKQTERRRFARLIVYGLLWAVIVIGLEVPTLTFNDGGRRQIEQLLVYLTSAWVFTSVLLSIAIYWSTIGQVRWLRLAVSIPFVAICSGTQSLLGALVDHWIFGTDALDWLIGRRSPWDRFLCISHGLR